MPEHVLKVRFQNGKELTNYELSQVYERLTGQTYPVGAQADKIAGYFSQHNPVRFEFEVNRVRGFAWDGRADP